MRIKLGILIFDPVTALGVTVILLGNSNKTIAKYGEF